MLGVGMLLFSYGSNSPKQLAERLGHPVEGRAAYAEGWMRVFRGYSERWQGAVASLLPSRGQKTYGYVAEVSPHDLSILDGYAGSRYTRTNLVVTRMDGRKQKAVAYLRDPREPFRHRPSRRYLEAVVATISSFWTGKDGKTVTVDDIPIR